MVYVKHKNPDHPLVKSGLEWAVDGPFNDTNEAMSHVNRCDYVNHGIQFEVYDDTVEVTTEVVTETKSKRKR